MIHAIIKPHCVLGINSSFRYIPLVFVVFGFLFIIIFRWNYFYFDSSVPCQICVCTHKPKCTHVTVKSLMSQLWPCERENETNVTHIVPLKNVSLFFFPLLVSSSLLFFAPVLWWPRHALCQVHAVDSSRCSSPMFSTIFFYRKMM